MNTASYGISVTSLSTSSAGAVTGTVYAMPVGGAPASVTWQIVANGSAQSSSLEGSNNNSTWTSLDTQTGSGGGTKTVSVAVAFIRISQTSRTGGSSTVGTLVTSKATGSGGGTVITSNLLTSGASTFQLPNNTVAETNAWSYSLPADSLANNGDVLHIVSWGSYLANGGGVNRHIRLYFGTTLLVHVSSGGGLAGFYVEGWVVRTGASAYGANGNIHVNGATPQIGVPVTGTDSLSATVNVRVTLQQDSTPAASIVQTEGFLVSKV